MDTLNQIVFSTKLSPQSMNSKKQTQPCTKKNMNSFCPRLSNTSSVAQSWRTRCWRRRRAVTTGRSPASRSRRLPLCRRPVANRGWTNGSATWTPLCAGLKRKSGSKCVYTIERVLGCREPIK